MSKGLSLTRDYLERNEISLIALIMGAIYLGFSAYTINTDNLKPVVILMLCILWYNIHKNSARVIETLNQRYTMMRLNNLHRTLQATNSKISMMKLFKHLSDFLFIAELLVFLITIFLGLLEDYEDSNTKIFIICSLEIAEIISVSGICIVFAAKHRGSFFDMADFENGDEIREVTPMYEAVNLAEDQETIQDKPFILINPTEDASSENIYKNMMIAIPMTPIYRRQSADELRQPLLSNHLIN